MTVRYPLIDVNPETEASHAASILLVDDDLGTIQVLGKALAGLGMIRFATRGDEALRMVRESPPDLILLDGEMPGMSGYEVCKTLKADPILAHIPVIFVTGHAEQDFEESGFGCGAADFIAKPVRPGIVAARARTQIALKGASDRLRALSSTDGLTGLANRREFDEALAREWRRTQRSGEPLSLLMIDIDHFKRYNDHYGHPQGDACLVQVAHALRGQLKRPADVAARYGGEEFALLLPSTDRQGAMALAQRLLMAVRQLGIPHAGSDCAPHVSISTGVSSYDQDCALWLVGNGATRSGADNAVIPADLIGAADAALYAAKRGGRARCAWGELDGVALHRLETQPLP